MKLAVIAEVHANAEALGWQRSTTLPPTGPIASSASAISSATTPSRVNASRCFAPGGALCVAGHHDRAIAGQSRPGHWARRRRRRWKGCAIGCAKTTSPFCGLPVKAVVENKLIAVHGALHLDAGSETVRLDTDARRALSMAALISHPSRARICAFGHAHELAIYERRSGKTVAVPDDEIELRHDAYYLINPRRGRCAARRRPARLHMLLDLAQRTLSVRRVDYDATIPFVPTDEAGLRASRRVSSRAVAQRHRQRPRRRPLAQTRRALIAGADYPAPR